ncbi:MAG: DUF1464 domain-containing protein [Candidatus Lokiarchaeota archaeon]|nr:DUF1464 domain-containing protein [Candidatus Lokiarchaeota archaeon]
MNIIFFVSTRLVKIIKVLGVDPGSYSWDFIGFDEEQGICLDHSIPTKQIQKNPEICLELIKSRGNFDLLSAPSGFGLPLKKIVDMSDEDFFLTILKKKSKKDSIIGLTQILKLLKKEKINGYMLPSVKHLPTVKRYHKINKIDLGTADKLCTSVVGIRNQMEDLSIPCNETSFIMVEMGYAFSAVLAIENGKIIDGIGGSNIMGFRAVGSIDGEVAYLMGKIRKRDVYKGGVSSIAGFGDMKAEELILLAKKDEKTQVALNAYYDSVKKAVYAISSSFYNPENIKQVLFAGRYARFDPLVKPLLQDLKLIAPTKVMRSYAQISKESAQGAAFIANGLLGGRFKDIVDTLQIRKASGSILDDIYLPLEYK